MQRQQHDLSDVLNLGVERGPVHLGINHEGCVFGSEPSHYAVCIICPLRALIDEEHSRERFGMAWERKDTITSGLSILAIFVSAYSLYKTSIFKELKVRASVAGLSDLKPPQAAAGKSRGGVVSRRRESPGEPRQRPRCGLRASGRPSVYSFNTKSVTPVQRFQPYLAVFVNTGYGC